MLAAEDMSCLRHTQSSVSSPLASFFFKDLTGAVISSYYLNIHRGHVVLVSY